MPARRTSRGVSWRGWVRQIDHQELGTISIAWSRGCVKRWIAAVTMLRRGEDRPASRDKAEQTARAVDQGTAGLPVAVQISCDTTWNRTGCLTCGNIDFSRPAGTELGETRALTGHVPSSGTSTQRVFC